MTLEQHAASLYLSFWLAQVLARNPYHHASNVRFLEAAIERYNHAYGVDLGELA